jgi:hypothetical protein
VNRTIPAIKEFPKDGRIWRVDWFGAVERNYDIPTEPYLQVVISPLRQGATDYASNNSVVHDDRKTILIGVGQLPLLSIGSLWQEGHCLPGRAGKATTFEYLEISDDTTRVVPANQVEEGQQLIPFNAHRVGGAGMGSKCIAISWKGDPYGVLIPMAEIVRFYYATSTDLAHALFSGAFRHDLHSLINTEKSGYVGHLIYRLENYRTRDIQLSLIAKKKYTHGFFDRTFKPSTDPLFVEKVHDIERLYRRRQ